jgi:hypothetical protein
MEERLAQRLGELDTAIRRTRADNRLGLESLRDVVEGVRRLEARLDQVVTSLAAAGIQGRQAAGVADYGNRRTGQTTVQNGSTDTEKDTVGLRPAAIRARLGKAALHDEPVTVPEDGGGLRELELSAPSEQGGVRDEHGQVVAQRREVEVGLAGSTKQKTLDIRKVRLPGQE